MNLINLLNQSHIPAHGTDAIALTIIKPINFTMNVNRQTTPIHRMGHTETSFRILERQVLSGTIAVRSQAASTFLEEIRRIHHVALDYNNATLVIEDITVTDLDILANSVIEVHYIAQKVKHYEKGIKPYVHTLTRTHEI